MPGLSATQFDCPGQFHRLSAIGYRLFHSTCNTTSLIVNCSCNQSNPEKQIQSGFGWIESDSTVIGPWTLSAQSLGVSAFCFLLSQLLLLPLGLCQRTVHPATRHPPIAPAHWKAGPFWVYLQVKKLAASPRFSSFACHQSRHLPGPVPPRRRPGPRPGPPGSPASRRFRP
jgi:hypothetical protein